MNTKSNTFFEKMDHETRPRYHGMAFSSSYIKMRDGVKLAADIWLPRNLPAGEKIPAILMMTRYWRNIELVQPLKSLIKSPDELIPVVRYMKPYFTGLGYALVTVDVRGTGASYGVWRFPWDPATIDDAWDVIEWIVNQGWSDGSVAGMGTSYLGMTAEMLLGTGHPALKAIVPMFNHPDPYTDITFPGGMFNERFIRAWSEIDYELDQNRIPPAYGLVNRLFTRGVRPVNGRVALAEALRMHVENGQVYEYAKGITFRDEIHPQGGYCSDDLCVIRHWEKISSNSIPTFGWGSWLDAGTGEAAIRRFQTYPGLQRAVIGDWAHGGVLHANPYHTSTREFNRNIVDSWHSIGRFLDLAVKGIDRDTADEKVLYYFTMGKEVWQRTTTWPPPGTRRERWYFGPDRSLRSDPPDQDGYDSYVVDFRSSSGTNNRWWELGILKFQTVTYPDLSAQPAELLSYTSPPIEHDFELNGTPVVSLYVDSSEPDCAFFVYLEDIDSQGKARYLTDGQLRSIHRKVSEQTPPYRGLGPYHTFYRADSMPLVPGEVGQVTFGLLPVSAWLERGHRIRISIAGHDQDTFLRVPEEGTPAWNVYRSLLYPSHVELPVKKG